MFEEDQYEENIKSLKKISSMEADYLLNNEDKAIVYMVDQPALSVVNLLKN